MKLKIITIVAILLLAFSSSVSAWYSPDWNHRIPITIDNSGNVSLPSYRFDVSIPLGINESSIRVVNDSTNTVVSHWAENVSAGVCYGLWFNGSVGNELSTDYYIYYGNDGVSSTSSYNDTFGDGIVLDVPLTSRYADGNTMIDRSPYGNNGTATEELTAQANGSNFNGINDYVNCGNDASLNITDELTVSIKTTYRTQAMTYPRIIYKAHVISGQWSDNCYALGILSTMDRLRFGTDGYNYINTVALEYGNQYHVVMTVSEGVGNLYINGVLDRVYSMSLVKGSDNNLYIGSDPVSYYTGFLSDTRIYNQALTQPEITSLYEQHNTTPSLVLGDEQTIYTTISLHSKYPETLFTNYTGLLSSSYIINSSHPLNFSSLAFLMGTNYTLTDDYHSYLKVPPNTIADGIYRAHNRNVSPLMAWESDSSITEGNVWKWGGGDNSDHWITNQSINSTHTWINISGYASNVFPSMFYLGRKASYESEKTPIEINKGQGVIFKIWDLEQFRGRNHDYYLSLYFDSQIETTPNDNIEIWYCNDSFNPLTDDPCLVCDYKDTWTGDRWIDHESWQPHNNVSFAKPLQIHAGTETCPSSPTEINYIYLKSDTSSSKSYILNATNSDPGICNLIYAETETMWLRDEVGGTNTPHSYTPSFYNTFVRNYLEFTHHLYIANDQGLWGHSDYITHEIGISDIPPTHSKYNYFWWNDTVCYNMTGAYTESFWINLTYGFDPDNGGALTHVLSLYDDDYNFVAFINDTLAGNQTDDDIWFDMEEYKSNTPYTFKLVSTDNEGSTSVSWSPIFILPRDNQFKNSILIIAGFPAVLSSMLETFLSYLPLLVGILISGFLIILSVGVFGKLKRW